MERMGRVEGVEVLCGAIDWCVECDFYGMCPYRGRIVYLVYGETYYRPYGSSPAIFGIFDNLKDAVKFKEEKIEYLWEEERKTRFNKNITKEEIHVDINSFTLNDPRTIKIGDIWNEDLMEGK